ncbi:hypothetical protein [Croceicoccus gelatinilyticus]|uniref:hypothetical protein n=1 Tax=Croceicoccus gelatinilyticus TaxID=2835536 RepID=UPI001BCC5AEB|nr:hypothetical protein [Croceicoccus gelatinilyticus]MBS7671360.1 hypothetical protein [Croceicoccus gelatinilyticus]
MPQLNRPDIDFTALCSRFEMAVIEHLGEPHMPISSVADFQTGKDPVDPRLDLLTGVAVMVFHDGSKIRFEVEWGIVPFNRADFERDLKKCIANIAPAAGIVKQERDKVHIVESVIAAMMLETRTIGEFKRLFQSVVEDRTGVRITPLSYQSLPSEETITQGFGRFKVRLKKAQLRFDNFWFREVFLRPTAILIDIDVPETMVTTLIGRPLKEAVDLPAFRDTNLKVKAIAPHDRLRTIVELDAPKVPYSVAVALAVRISENSLAPSTT